MRREKIVSVEDRGFRKIVVGEVVRAEVEREN